MKKQGQKLTFPELFGAIGRLLRVEFIHGPWGQIFYTSRNPRNPIFLALSEP
uniref:Uncharacterized protein n=1 Tax=Solanum tuberosum TaxID=4113 RepID=M0ZZS4_SOLTU